MTDVVIHPHSRKLLKMDILMSETCWAHIKWNKIASNIRVVFHSSTLIMMHGPINIRSTLSILGSNLSLRGERQSARWPSHDTALTCLPPTKNLWSYTSCPPYAFITPCLIKCKVKDFSLLDSRLRGLPEFSAPEMNLQRFPSNLTFTVPTSYQTQMAAASFN